MGLMHLQVKTAANGRNKELTEKQAARKVLLIFPNVKMLKEMQQRCFKIL